MLFQSKSSDCSLKIHSNDTLCFSPAGKPWSSLEHALPHWNYIISTEIDADVLAVEIFVPLTIGTVDDSAFLIHCTLDADSPGSGIGWQPSATRCNVICLLVVSFFWQPAPIVLVCRESHLWPNIRICFDLNAFLSNKWIVILKQSDRRSCCAWMVTVAATAGARTKIMYQMSPLPGGSAAGGHSPPATESRLPLLPFAKNYRESVGIGCNQARSTEKVCFWHET